jgi:hypothetical protein
MHAYARGLTPFVLPPERGTSKLANDKRVQTPARKGEQGIAVDQSITRFVTLAALLLILRPNHQLIRNNLNHSSLKFEL